MSNVIEIVKRCLSFDDEQEWFDFKDNWFEIDEIGQYISALSNADRKSTRLNSSH